MNDRVLAALRELRALAIDGHDLARQLLEIVAAATASTSVTLRYSHSSEEVRVGGADAGPDAARLERRFPLSSGEAIVTAARASGSPFEADDAFAVELLGGEVALRVEQAGALAETRRLKRQLELHHALSRAGEEALRLPELADRAAREILGVFTGAHVLFHVVVDHHLQLIARHLESGSGMDGVPDWVRRLPLDGPSVMAVAAREKRVVSRPVQEIPEPRRAFLEETGVRQLLTVPLLLHDAVFGTLTVAHRHDEPWDAESLRLLESAAAQLSVDLAHVRLLEAEWRRAEDLGLINEVGAVVAQHLDLPAVLSTAVKELARITQVPRVHVLLANAERTMLDGVACTEDALADMVIPITSSAVVAHAFRKMEPIVVENTETDPRASKSLVEVIGVRSLIAVPLLSRGEAIGAIMLGTRELRSFTEAEVARVVAVANLVAPAVANAKMFDDLRRSYETLARTQAALVTQERLAALGELSAVIAHEVRNPVAIIFNSLGALRRLEPPAGDASKLLDIVGEEAARLNRIVGDLLDLVRPYAPHPRLVQLDVLVQGAVDAARRTAMDTSIEVRTDLHLPSTELYFDGTMFQQALINLIVNALQATPRGGTVTLRASTDTEGATPRLCCSVLDEGSGVDVADSARVFQPFFTTKATGTGLGLALVRRIADALGGTVDVGRGPTGGALFRLTVPLGTPPPEP